VTGGIRLVIYGYRGPAQFQIVAGSMAGLRGRHEKHLRRLASEAATDAARFQLPAGRADRVGTAECYAVAIPTAEREEMSGRPGLAVSFVILSWGIVRSEPDLVVQALAGMELALATALPVGSVDIRRGAEVLTQCLQSDDAEAASQALTRHTEGAERILDAIARQRRPLLRSHVPAGVTFNVNTARIEYCLLATLVEGLRSARRAQQGLILRLGRPAPLLSSMRAHQFLYDMVVFSQDAPAGPL
jgi:hypothetical protein